MAFRRTVHKSSFRKMFALSGTLFLTAVVLVINRPASAGVTITPTTNFQVDINAGEAVSVDCSAGVVRVTVDAVPNVTATPCAAVTSFRVTAVGAFSNIINLSGVTTANFTALTSVDVDGGAENDIITGSDIGDQLRGGSGDDALFGGAGSGADSLEGGEGNDLMVGGTGDDFGYGGAGSDTFVWSPGDADDLFEGDEGDDTLAFAGANGADTYVISSDNGRTLFQRQPGNVGISTGGVENIVANSETIQLSGRNEVPSNNTPSSGFANFTYNPTTGTFDIRIFVLGITQANLIDSHIHMGIPGSNGPVVIPFGGGAGYTPVAGGLELVVAGLTTASIVPPAGFTAQQVLTEILLGRAYFNVHTTANPGGEVRGNIIISGPTAGSGGADSLLVRDTTGTSLKSIAFDAGNEAEIRNGAPLIDTVTVEGLNTPDTITASVPNVADNNYRVSGLPYNILVTGSDGNVANGALRDLLSINGNDGNDALTADSDVDDVTRVTLNGGIGDDVLSADGTLNGGDGNDSLTGGPGNNTMDGGAGDDVFAGNGGTDSIGGGAGSSIGDAILATGTGGNDVFNLALNASGHLVAVVNGLSTTYQNFIGGAASTSGVELIRVQGLAGADTLTVDSSNGAVSIPINFAGGENVDSLNLTGGAATSNTYTAGPLVDQGLSQVVIGGVTQTISFTSIEPMIDLIAGPFTVNGNNANNVINYTQGSVAANGLVSIDNFETVEFSNKTTLTINGLAGSDQISLANASTPTGLTGNCGSGQPICVNGGDPGGSDSLVLTGTPAAETFEYAPNGPNGGLMALIGTDATFTGIEVLLVDGQSALNDDTLIIRTEAGADALTFQPGANVDSGIFHINSTAGTEAPQALAFRSLGQDAFIELRSGAGLGSREDTFEYFGTDAADTFTANTSDGGTLLLSFPLGSRKAIRAPGVSSLILHGLDDDDTFNVPGDNPFTLGVFVKGGDPSASDVLNYTTGGVFSTFVDLGSVPGSTFITTGVGGAVHYAGVETANINTSGGSLSVTGSTGDDRIEVRPTGAGTGNFRATTTGAVVVNSPQFIYTGVGAAAVMFGGFTGFDTLDILGNDANDTVTSTATTVTIKGGTITLGSLLEQLNISPSGGDDNVTLTGLTLPITVDAGDGNDSVSGTGVTSAMTIFGGDGNDSIVGGSASDLIYGGSGNDTMAGGGGTDQLYGGEGNDILGNPSAVANGVADDAGNDQFFGDSGSDTFFWEPGDGDDLVEGGAGDSDQIQFFGNAGAEQFFVFADLTNQSRLHIFRVQAGIDIDASDIEEVNVTSAGGTDTVTVGRSDTGTLSDLSTTGVRLVNVLLGDDAAADSIIVEGRPVNDNILVSLPGPGNFDLVRMAGLSYDVIFAGLDSPVIDRITVNGNEGNDEIKAVDGVEAAVNITLNGGAGNDVLSADAILSGGDGNDTLKGGNGNDTMDGGNGDDVLVFTAGNDTMTGGAGVDTLRAEGDDAANTISLSQAGTIVTISTGLANGTVDFTGALSMERIDVFAFGGNDNITASGVSLPKTIDAGAGNDTVDLSAAVDATILGRDGDDILTGSPAADNIDGGPGNDTLSGLGGVDVLNGGDGNDSLTGGTGNDQMFGDAGSDTLVWNNGDGSDLMEGGGGTDTVQVNGSNAAGDAFLITPNGARVRFDRTNLGPFNLDIGSAEELTVNGLDGDDAFSATPLAETHITINGANPVPPASPGDQLNIDFTGALNSIRTPTGVGAGIWSFNNRQSINFNGIETQGPVGPAITINNVGVAEGNAGSTSATFTASLSAASAQTISVDVSTANGTASAPVDYQSAAATLTFLPGVTTANFSVPINGDTDPEGNETFFANLTNPVNATIATPQGTGTINDDDSTNIFQFSSATGNVNENAVPGSATVTVTRTGDLAGAASVQFETNDGTGKQKTDYTFGFGTVQFGPGEGSRDVKILVVNDVLIEGAETFQVSLSNPSGNCAIGAPGTITVTINDDDVAVAPNPIDDAGFFVRQHYLDFLGREPDAGGLAFWTGQITACGGNASCIAAKRVDVSASFFLSQEFQETGGFALRIQRAAFGRQSNDPATRYPYLPFMRDSRTIGQGVVIGQPGAEALLEQNKQTYAEQIGASADFAVRFPAAPAAVFVDALFASAGVVPTAAERTAAINAFGAGGNIGRVAALRSVTDSASLRAAESRISFVLAEYYGYLRRNPTDAPDFNNAGYQFWLDKLNLFNGNYIDAEMVKAFITSFEYRQRFGP